MSYLPQGSLNINVALGNLESVEGDKFKTLGPFADYYEGFGWFGSFWLVWLVWLVLLV